MRYRVVRLMDHADETIDLALDDREVALAAQAASAAIAHGAVVVECGLHRSRGSAAAHVVVYAAEGMDAARLGKLTADLQFRLGTEPVLDAATLEVRTPGINRKFKADAEFEIFTGKAVKVLLEKADDWQEGLISHVRDGELTLAPLSGQKGQSAVVPIAQIRKAQLTGAEHQPSRLVHTVPALSNGEQENTDV